MSFLTGETIVRSRVDDIRKGKIALAYLKEVIRVGGVTPELRRQVSNVASSIGIPGKRCEGVVENILRELDDDSAYHLRVLNDPANFFDR